MFYFCFARSDNCLRKIIQLIQTFLSNTKRRSLCFFLSTGFYRVSRPWNICRFNLVAIVVMWTFVPVFLWSVWLYFTLDFLLNETSFLILVKPHVEIIYGRPVLAKRDAVAIIFRLWLLDRRCNGARYFLIGFPRFDESKEMFYLGYGNVLWIFVII